ncbi:hypothetical protein BJ742DRAFT_767694 [Cladochytrium replicatum]|nr:hypothetical protein BJ742DRAFT_767694 [Cladochytrium replicatum]
MSSVSTISLVDPTTSHLDALFAATIAVVVTALSGYSWFAAQNSNSVLQSRGWALTLLKATLVTLAVHSFLRWIGLVVEVTSNPTVDAVFHGMSSLIEYITLPCSHAILFLRAHDLNAVVGKKLNASVAYAVAALIALGGIAGGVTGVYGIVAVGAYHHSYFGAFAFAIFASFVTLVLSAIVFIPVIGKANLSRARRTRDLAPPSTESEFQSVVWTTKSVCLLLGAFSTLTILTTVVMMVQGWQSHSISGMLIQLLAALSCFLSIGIARSVQLLDPSHKVGDTESPPPSYVEKMAIDFKESSPIYPNGYSASKPSPPPTTHNMPRPVSTTLGRGYLNANGSYAASPTATSPQSPPSASPRPGSPTRDPADPSLVRAIRRTSTLASQSPRLSMPPPPAAAVNRRRSQLDGPQLARPTSTLGSPFAGTSSGGKRSPGGLREGEMQMMSLEEEEAARRMERRRSLALNMTPYIAA